jgi:hypothetical protein
LNNVYQISFLNIKYCCTTTREIENIMRTLKTLNSCGYDEVPSKLLKLCSFILAPPWITHAVGLFTPVFFLIG